MGDRPLVIWAGSPPVVERGAFAYLEEQWPAGVVYAVLGELRAERVAMGWRDEASGGGAILRARPSTSSVAQFCDEIMRDYPRGVHLLGGLTSTTGRALARIARSVPPERIAVYSERPGVYGSSMKRLAARVVIPLKYGWLVRRYRRQVGLLLPLGRAGLERFARCGWPRERMAPFMYCPPVHGGAPSPIGDRGGPVRLLYVGRLSRFTKGTDVLLKAVDLLFGDWTLTIIGGHGDLVDDVESWAATKTHVDCIGVATPDEVREAMDRHDVCVVPSRFDGWNVVVNEALYAARGVIVTDEAVSHEMVSESGAGLVVKAKSARQLAEAMQQVIEDRSLARTWSWRAIDYEALISPESVGAYLFELLQALISYRPISTLRAPWLRTWDLEGEE